MKTFVYDYKYFFGTLLLALGLGIPWAFSLLSASLEPYPAIVMPTGARTLLLEDSISYELSSVWAQSGDEWRELGVTELFAPIPNWYFPAMSKTDFGLENNTVQQLELRLLPDLNLKRSKVSPEEVTQAKTWLAERLTSLGYAPDRFEIRSERVSIERLSGVISEREVTDVKRYNLY